MVAHSPDSAPPVEAVGDTPQITQLIEIEARVEAWRDEVRNWIRTGVLSEHGWTRVVAEITADQLGELGVQILGYIDQRRTLQRQYPDTEATRDQC